MFIQDQLGRKRAFLGAQISESLESLCYKFLVFFPIFATWTTYGFPIASLHLQVSVELMVTSLGYIPKQMEKIQNLNLHAPPKTLVPRLLSKQVEVTVIVCVDMFGTREHHPHHHRHHHLPEARDEFETLSFVAIPMDATRRDNGPELSTLFLWKMR